jgi:hypothetical protein
LPDLQWRLNKKIRKHELGANLKPCFDELGLSADLSGQFFYPPGGFRIWHTNCFDGLGWRGYIVILAPHAVNNARERLQPNSELYPPFRFTSTRTAKVR